VSFKSSIDMEELRIVSQAEVVSTSGFSMMQAYRCTSYCQECQQEEGEDVCRHGNQYGSLHVIHSFYTLWCGLLHHARLKVMGIVVTSCRDVNTFS
jgi:hypothetical protein